MTLRWLILTILHKYLVTEDNEPQLYNFHQAFQHNENIYKSLHFNPELNCASDAR